MTAILALLGCPAISLGALEGRFDADGDGYEARTFGGSDCADDDREVHPDAEEVWYDGVDQDCDGADDDRDGDGFGVADDCDDEALAVNPDAGEACDGLDGDCSGAPGDDEVDADGDGFRICEGDCDDADAAVHPDAVEVCDESATDEDCDRDINDGDDEVQGMATWYADADGDGFGDPESTTEACGQPFGYVSGATDCDDADATRFPGATWYADADRDGFGDDAVTTETCSPEAGWVADGGDCDDADAGVHPEAEEGCDGVDDDCDGLLDDADPDVAEDEAVWYRDADGDGWGVDFLTLRTCETLTGYAHLPGDCDDAEPRANPGAVEVCDDLDDDCDGLADDADPDVTGAPTWYADADRDGWGDATLVFVACDAPSGYGAGAGDCDEADPTVNDGAGETCDGRDEDCDGLVDDDDPDLAGAPVWYVDADGDGWGGETTVAACDLPVGASEAGGDCDDADAAVSPGATEACATEADDDCDGDANDDGADGCAPLYADADADGFGAGDPACLCVAGETYAATVDGDCDDADAAVSPAGVETCLTAADDDCDGSADAEGAEGCVERYLDADHDGFGAGDAACHCAGESDWRALLDGDCDDADEDVWPSAPVTCLDDVDDDCDGAIDACAYTDADLAVEGLDADGAGGAVAWVDDVDGDGAPDLVVGATGMDVAGTAAGGAWLLSGASSGDGYAGDRALATLSGGDDAWSLGMDVTGVGDLDGDGVGDVLLASTYADGSAEQAGGVYVFPGASRGDLSAFDAVFAVEGDSASHYFGGTPARVADANGDGVEDLAVGAPMEDVGEDYDLGAVYVAFGPLSGFTRAADHVRIGGVLEDDAAGEAVVAADLDADGRTDLVTTGQRDGECAAWVFAADGLVDGTVDEADARLTVPLYYTSGYHCRAAPIGDADGDGAEDVAYASPYDATGGTTWIVTGLPSADASVEDVATATLTPGSTSRHLGMSLAPAGDLDGDGRADLLVGDTLDDEAGSNAGVVWAVATPDAGSHVLDDVALAYIYGDAGDGLGGAVAGGADGDGDGALDVLLGASSHDGSGSGTGGAWVWRGGSP